MRVIIIAGGESTRWANYLGVPKHLAPIFGKPLLHDTIDKIRPYCDDIWVTTQSDVGEIYGCKTIRVTINPDNYDADKFINSSHMWIDDGVNYIFYGDVYFTNYAIIRIFTEVCEWSYFSRFGASPFTLKPYGENFAIKFHGSWCARFREALKEVVKKNQEEETKRSGGWELYRQLCGIDLNKHAVNGHFVDINDFTEDFDYPVDYDNWLKRYKELNSGNTD